MTENEFMLQDRIQKIKSINELYDLEKNSYISFSGGKDSTVLSALIDLALSDNKIPRVNVNTGIELKMISDFVKRKAEIDSRIIILHPTQSITKTLQEYGYPFKSKMHSHMVALYQRIGLTYGIHHYLQDEQAEKTVFRPCPKKLKYQFTPEFNLKISDKCCFYLKEKPMTDWSKENSRYKYIYIYRCNYS
jgi:3'-phosphoadenosine 5'-phosphosulfate sulfotransferase (PAPS reductase)/FAD synthetase